MYPRLDTPGNLKNSFELKRTIGNCYCAMKNKSTKQCLDKLNDISNKEVQYSEVSYLMKVRNIDDV